jgi:flagellar M-ring protein FliF
VEGLQAQNVSVVDNHGNSLSDNDARDSIAGLSGTQLNAQRNLEQYLSKKAEGMLDKVLGPGQSVVRVAAEINFDSLTRTEEKYDPDGQVIRNSTVTDETNDATTGSGSGGSPGVAANAPSETNSVSGAAVNNTKMKKKQTTSTYEINRSTSQIMQAAGGLKRVSAAVFIATKTEGTGTARKPVARPKEELDKLRRIVQSALGIQAGEESTRQDEITLEEIPFNDEPLLEVTQQLGKQERTQFWWDKAQESVYALIALAALFFFWRMLKKAPAEEIPIGIPLRKFAHAGNGNGNGHVNGHHDSHGNTGNLLSDWQKSPTPPAVTVEVLNQLLKENPNNLTQAIRTWMTRGQTKK